MRTHFTSRERIEANRAQLLEWEREGRSYFWMAQLVTTAVYDMARCPTVENIEDFFEEREKLWKYIYKLELFAKCDHSTPKDAEHECD